MTRSRAHFPNKVDASPLPGSPAPVVASEGLATADRTLSDDDARRLAAALTKADTALADVEHVLQAAAARRGAPVKATRHRESEAEGEAAEHAIDGNDTIPQFTDTPAE